MSGCQIVNEIVRLGVRRLIILSGADQIFKKQQQTLMLSIERAGEIGLLINSYLCLRVKTAIMCLISRNEKHDRFSPIENSI